MAHGQPQFVAFSFPVAHQAVIMAVVRRRFDSSALTRIRADELDLERTALVGILRATPPAHVAAPIVNLVLYITAPRHNAPPQLRQ